MEADQSKEPNYFVLILRFPSTAKTATDQHKRSNLPL